MAAGNSFRFIWILVLITLISNEVVIGSGTGSADQTGKILIKSNSEDSERLVKMEALNQTNIIYVKHIEDSPNAWQNRSPVYTNITEAIHVADSNTSIWIAKGKYLENIALKDNISLYGGFNGDETSIDERRNILEDISKTTIDGRNMGRCILTASANVIDGFTLINGKEDYGGGIGIFNNSDIEIRNIYIESCIGDWRGGGIYVESLGQEDSIFIERVIVWKCKSYCGALEIDERTTVTVTVRNCTIVQNDSYGLEVPWDEGITPANRNHDFYNCIVWGNSNPRYVVPYSSDVVYWARGYTDFSYIGGSPWPADAERWGPPLPNNIHESDVGEPGFLNLDSGDFHLVSTSPCISAGKNGSNMGAFSSNPIFITAPNGGESWLVGTTQNIIWTSTGSLSAVQLELSTDNGATWTIIAANTANDGSESWTIPNNVSSQCLVRVSDAADGNPSDVSDGLFSIVTYASSPEIAVSPTSISFSAIVDGGNPASQNITVTNTAEGILAWTAAEGPDQSWMSLTNISGGSGNDVTVSVTIAGLSAGTYSGTVRITDPNASNNPVDVPVTLTIDSPSMPLVLELKDHSRAFPGEDWTNAIDGDVSGWDGTVTAEGDPPYAIFGFSNGATNQINKVRLLTDTGVCFSTRWVDAFRVMVSATGTNESNFTTVLDAVKSGGAWEEFTFGAVSAKYIKFIIDAPTSDYRQLGEFEVYGASTLAKNTSPDSTSFDENMSDTKINAAKETTFSLDQNYPNPFNLATTIKYQLSKPAKVSLTIFNLAGHEMIRLVDAAQNAGVFQLSWDGKDQEGLTVTTGIYIFQLKAGGFITSRKLLFVK